MRARLVVGAFAFFIASLAFAAPARAAASGKSAVALGCCSNGCLHGYYCCAEGWLCGCSCDVHGNPVCGCAFE